MKIIVYSKKYNTFTNTKINSYYDAAIKRSKLIKNFFNNGKILKFNDHSNNEINISINENIQISKIYELSENTFFVIYN